MYSNNWKNGDVEIHKNAYKNYDCECGFDVTSNVGLTRTTIVGLTMTTNVGLNITTELTKFIGKATIHETLCMAHVFWTKHVAKMNAILEHV